MAVQGEKYVGSSTLDGVFQLLLTRDRADISERRAALSGISSRGQQALGGMGMVKLGGPIVKSLELGGREVGLEVVGSPAVGSGQAQVPEVDTLEMAEAPVLRQHCGCAACCVGSGRMRKVMGQG